MKTQKITEMLKEQNLSTTGDVTVDGPWAAPGLKDQRFPIHIHTDGVTYGIGNATVKIDGAMKFEIEIDEAMLSEDVVGTFEVPMVFHVRKK